MEHSVHKHMYMLRSINAKYGHIVSMASFCYTRTPSCLISNMYSVISLTKQLLINKTNGGNYVVIFKVLWYIAEHFVLGSTI